MNPVTFNDNFNEFVKYEAKNKEQCRAMAKSPLIVWREDSQEDFNINDYPESFYDNSCPRLPFNQFRVDGFYHYQGSGWFKYKAWVNLDGEQTNPNGFTVVIEIEECEELGSKKLLSTSVPIITITFLFIGKRDGKPFYKAMYGHYSVVHNKSFKHELTSDKVWAIGCEWIYKLCMDFSNPHFYLCKKSPPIPQGKTVFWQKAREHYVLLHKSHEANKVESHGKRIIEDGMMVERAAHSRRAHFRLLKSPKFRFKVGQRIWIKSAWVGPKEWADHSGQIYKIVDKP